MNNCYDFFSKLHRQLCLGNDTAVAVLRNDNKISVEMYSNSTYIRTELFNAVQF
jgi:hypothetical protein